ncbi:3-hydroxybutyryl-CoA dehydrogenase [Elizabethkingia argentiflava]|uniref:3-hydroxybutyryl-CoA dehydrogenase n=1 Tax=Elizabethkingia argenteiflava TaxID=2681556 RepID=A0A845PV15_9FLAO|nr:3-hydroxyacyl-CoA dehydrogenase NAD-binding domain-containing protein [Elizabethkingia argenteiflava]NAW51495.1 3-hydroxybutyryl-CoA dehydrogenase [Elizabethkingia argenteiflava]
MKKIGVIGSGTMGIGIAQVAAMNACTVFLYDNNGAQIDQALHHLQNLLEKLVAKQKTSKEQATEIMANIKSCKRLEDLKHCDLIIEAIVESKELKIKVFQELENHISDHCIIGSNTSSISITSLSSGLSIPQRFIGVHFFNPAPLMPLVEVIPGLLTDLNLPQQICKLMQSWGKVSIFAKDVPGFIVNRIARPYYGEALRIVEEKIASPQQVDEAMRLLGNFRMGPFELMDFIGIDVNLAVSTTVFRDYFYDPKYKPSLLQQRMDEAKLHGRKTGRGFYDYSEGAERPQAQKDEVLYRQIFLRIIAMLINEAVEAKRLEIASDEDLELAVQKGLNYPKGLLGWGREIGYSVISQTLQTLYEEYQEERYRQSPLLKKLH